MRKFPCLLFVLKRWYICYYVICMTAPVIFSLNLKSVDQISIYFTASELKKSFLKGSRYLYISPSEWYEVIHLSNSSYLC